MPMRSRAKKHVPTLLVPNAPVTILRLSPPTRHGRETLRAHPQTDDRPKDTEGEVEWSRSLPLGTTCCGWAVSVILSHTSYN